MIGTVVENSLNDKGTLDRLHIPKTWQDGDWTLHIKRSDTSTWQNAITHGRSLGIPFEQLDFVIPQSQQYYDIS